MAFEEQLPEWEAEGTQPPKTKRMEGWNPAEKPPASWFNWLFHRTYKALQELQQKAAEKVDVQVAQQIAQQAEQTAQQAVQTASQTAGALASHLNDFAQVWSNRIVEMSSNANGTYVRWENGLQVCFADRDIIRWNPQTSPNQGLNNAYYTTHLIWVYPASFISPPVISCSIEHAGSGNLWGLSVVYPAGILEGSCNLWLWTEHAREGESYGTAAAIGRWK